MPARQRGRIEKLPSGNWSVRYYDEAGARQRQGGFETKSAAAEWLDRKTDEVEALRRGDRPVDELRTAELAAWRATLPARSRHNLFRSFRQVLEQAVTWQLLDRNPS